MTFAIKSWKSGPNSAAESSKYDSRNLLHHDGKYLNNLLIYTVSHIVAKTGHHWNVPLWLQEHLAENYFVVKITTDMLNQY